MKASFTLAGLLAAISLGLPAAASAESANKNAPRLMPPQVRAWMDQQALQQKVNGAVRSAEKVDTKPPVLTSFNAPITVDARFSAGSFLAFTATDNLSGISWAYGYIQGPSGQSVNTWIANSLPSKNFTGGLVLRDLTVFSEPGTYTVSSVTLVDVAGNSADFDADALAALGGRTSFEVVNTQGYDAKPPKLKSGKVLTPQLSLSDTTPGTNLQRFAGLQVNAVDQGNTAVSGVSTISADFCLADVSVCLYLFSEDNADGPASSQRLAGQLGGLVSGEYHLHYIQIRDYGNNSQFLFSSEFGGDTDFSLYFPSTTITLTP